MKKFLLFLCMICGISLYGQQFKANLSQIGDFENDVTDFHKYGKLVYSGKVNWGKMQLAYTANLKKIKYGVELTQYDEQLKEIKKLSLDNGKKDFGPFRPLIHYGKSAIYVMYFKLVEGDKMKLYAAKVNPDDLTIIATKEIMEYDQKNQGFWGSVKTIEDTQTFYTVSADGKTAMIVHASPKLIVSSVIDGDLNMIQKTESIPVKMEELLVTGSYIGNDGNKVLAYRYDDPKFKEFYSRGLFFQAAGSQGNFIPVKFPDGHFPGNLQLNQSNDGKKLYLGGEYYGEDYARGGRGVMLGEVNVATQSFSTPAFYPYTDALKQRIVDLDFASKKKGEIIFADRRLNYVINDMDDGTVVMSSDMHTSASTSNYTFYYSGPIIHVFIKPNGKSTMTLIPKKQTDATFTNFFNYINDNKLVCIYGDLPKYQEKDFSDKDISLVRTVGGMVPVANTYDSDGKLLSRRMLIDGEAKMKGNVMIGNRSKIGDKQFLFPVGQAKVSMAKYYTSVNQIWYLDIF